MNSQTIVCKQLAEYPQVIEQVSKWIYEQWWNNGTNSPDLVYNLLKDHLIKDNFPYTIVAFDNHKPIGSCCIINNDCAIRPQYSPWLAAVYIKEEYRGLNIGSHMIQEAFTIAEKIRLDGLYIDCANKTVPFYEKNGWQVIERVPESEDKDTIILLRKVNK